MVIHDAALYLKLANEDDEILKEFKDIILDKFKIHEHDNLIRLLKTDEYIESNKYDRDVKHYNDTLDKIKVLRQLKKKDFR